MVNRASSLYICSHRQAHVDLHMMNVHWFTISVTKRQHVIKIRNKNKPKLSSSSWLLFMMIMKSKMIIIFIFLFRKKNQTQTHTHTHIQISEPKQQQQLPIVNVEYSFNRRFLTRKKTNSFLQKNKRFLWNLFIIISIVWW